MKFTKRNSFLTQLLMAVALIALLSALVLPAMAQVTPTNLRSLTNLPTVINTTTVSNQTSIVSIPQDRNVAVAINFNTSGAGTDLVTVWARPSVDGTNFQTVNPLIITAAANGTTQVIGGTNWNKSILEGYRALNFYAISNASGARTVYLTNIYVGNRN